MAREKMKLTIQHLQVRSTDELDSRVEERLVGLEPRLRIEQAIVALSHDREGSPAFRARIHVVTPGPDLLVEAADHTLAAALTKAFNDLERSLDARDRSRAWRARSNRQNPAHVRWKCRRGSVCP